MALKPEELKTIAVSLQELGLSYDEAVKVMSGITEDAKCLRPLLGKPCASGQSGSRLIKFGVSLIVFPVPTIGIKKSLGATLIAVGLAQQRMKHMHISDVYSTFQDITAELKKLNDESVGILCRK